MLDPGLQEVRPSARAMPSRWAATNEPMPRRRWGASTTTCGYAWAGESRGETMSFAAATGRPSSAGSSPDRKTRKRRLVTGPGIVQSASVCWLVSSTRPGPYVAA
ncbi:hypothetical protein [Pseudoclavibacter helvolus]|uniref:hypothetical protein n=1 Tax=Pseudoclavibacter helvolus TaxID=255205 RepID=UPI0024AD097A|nr:hypothetical protein [Pseudoclavibacter helvolus]